MPLTADNIGDVEAVSALSSTPYYELPVNALASAKSLQIIDTVRDGGCGDELLAYATESERWLVGGGSYLCILGKLSIGCWVASGFRGQGYGHQIAGTIEDLAIADFPQQGLIEVQIHPDNTGSQKIFTARGYEPTGHRDSEGNDIFQKQLVPVMS